TTPRVPECCCADEPLDSAVTALTAYDFGAVAGVDPGCWLGAPAALTAGGIPVGSDDGGCHGADGRGEAGSQGRAGGGRSWGWGGVGGGGGGHRRAGGRAR